MSNEPTRELSVEEFLVRFDPPLQLLAQAARKRIRLAVPHAVERVRLGWKLIGYNAPAYFAFIAFEREHIRIGFEWGVLLADPGGLLEGAGSQVRHLSIQRVGELRNPAVTDLLRAAATQVPPPRARFKVGHR